jgi:glycosyltransferase involved in cell wall biosynthesis
MAEAGPGGQKLPETPAARREQTLQPAGAAAPRRRTARPGPLVSIIVPCYNEETTIPLLLRALNRQTFPRQDLEVIIADGGSTDGTRQAISGFQEDHPDLSIAVVDNPHRIIPAGLNRALAAARGQYIVRLDAHSVPSRDYVDRCVRALREGHGDNVGGIWEIKPSGDGWQARSVAAAASHPLGVGDARYRTGGRAQLVDTVPFGAFHRDLIDRIGPYDETLQTNEDYELNVRLRQADGKVWMDPRIRSVYFARPDLASLARQYWRYGYWKAQMLRRYPNTLRWRQLSALLVLSLVGLAALSPFFLAARLLLILELGVYLGALLVAGLQTSLERNDMALLVGVPLAIATMHFSWGTAFLLSLPRMRG